MKAKSKKELRNEFQVSKNTFNAWIRKIPGFIIDKKAHIFQPREVQIIYDHLGNPAD
jgi:hypothetical protein